jgi:hypothetical protein
VACHELTSASRFGHISSRLRAIILVIAPISSHIAE